MGRKPEIRWGKRIIDIDILYYQSKIINQEKLIIPHKLMHQRKFVMIPLNDLGENHLHPILKITNKPLVSMDYIGEKYSAIIDTRWINIINSELIKIVLWYDNEFGYCCNVINQIKYIDSIL